MATYSDFKISGVKGQSSLDAAFILSCEIDFTEQKVEYEDKVELFDVPENTAVIGVSFVGKGQGSAEYVEKNEVIQEAEESEKQQTEIIFADKPIAEGNEYKIKVGDNTYSHTAETTLTWAAILAALETAIEGGEDIVCTVTSADRKIVLEEENNNVSFETEVWVDLADHEVRIGDEDDNDAIVGDTDLKAADLDIYSSATKFYDEKTTIKLENVTEDVPLSEGEVKVSLVCVTI